MAADLERSLLVVVPLDPSHAAWVQFEETPTYVKADKTKFIVHPPFDGTKPPRFSFYLPHEEGAVLNREMYLSVVDEDKPFDSGVSTIWTVKSLHHASVIAQGVMSRRSDSSITIYDQTTKMETKFGWPNPSLRLEREAPLAFSSAAVLGECPSGMPSPVGVRYGLQGCLNARLAYMVDMSRLDDGSYACVIQRQYTITNDSDVRFDNITQLAIASETFASSEDGFPTRAMPLDQVVTTTTPLFSLRQVSMSIAPYSRQMMIDAGATIDKSYVALTVGSPPTQVGELATFVVDTWLPTKELLAAIPQPGVIQLHINNEGAPHNNITGVSHWMHGSEKLGAWTRVTVPAATTRVVVQCTGRETRIGTDSVYIAVSNVFNKALYLSFVVTPDRLVGIEAVHGARAVDCPWKDNAYGVNYAVFELNDTGEPILFKGTVPVDK